jgi:hypothetical protein
LWIACALVVAACSRQESGWRGARSEDTVAAYETYLEHFPAGAYTNEARARIRELHEEREWARASQLQTPEGLQRYLGAYPEGRYAEAARERLSVFVMPGVPAGERQYFVQLGAYSTEAAARADLLRLSRDHADLLGALELNIEAAAANAPPLWRLRSTPLAESAARRICADLKSRAVDCAPTAK